LLYAKHVSDREMLKGVDINQIQNFSMSQNGLNFYFSEQETY